MIQKALLIDISHTDIVVYLLRSTLYTQIMWMTNGLILVIVFKPIRIAILGIICTSPVFSVTRYIYSRKFLWIWILHESLNLFYNRVWDSINPRSRCTGIIQSIIIISKLQRIHHLWSTDRRTKTNCSRITYFSFFRISTFSCNQYHTIGGTGTINRGCRGVFQHTDTSNIGGIHILHTLFDSVYQYIRFATIDRANTTDIEFYIRTQLTSFSSSHCIRCEI